MVNRFLIIAGNPEIGDTTEASFKAEAEIISFVDMQDCHDQTVRVFDLLHSAPVELRIHGSWHNPNNPLYIMLTDPYGNVVVDGYGTNH